jgi:hypothetical protein
LEDRQLPSTLTVTNLADGGDGSLRGQLAAAAPGDTIAFAPQLQGTIALGSTLTLDRDVTVAGNLDAAGSPLVTLSRGGADESTDLLVGAGVISSVGGLGFSGATWHALEIQGSVTLDHVTVSGNRIGYYAQGAYTQRFFGTVYNTGDLTVQDSTIGDNRVNGRAGWTGPNGGAGIWSTGTLTVLRTRLVNNLSEGGNGVLGSGPLGGYGGGICNYGGTATVTACTLTGNQAAEGGGLYSGSLTSTGTLTVSGCTVSGNRAVADGGGLSVTGTAQVTVCTITNNTAVGDGGGMVCSRGTLTLSGSTLAGNQAGGGDTSGEGGGLWVRFLTTAPVSITNCTIANNSAVGYVYQGQLHPGVGGGLYVVSLTGLNPVLTVVGSTVAGNWTDGTGGGFYVPSGPLSSVLAVTVVGSTVAGNRAGGAGGGLWVSATRTSAILTSTLVAGNTAATAGPDVSGPVRATSAYDLIGDGSGASGLTDGVNGNQVGSASAPIDPLLGPLQNNGGPTQTMALLAGSLALNAGDPTELGVADQRGVVRSGGVNIGAYQASADSLTFTGPATVTAGTPFSMTVTAVDQFEQVAVGYTGTVHFVASNGAMANYTFTAADGGQHTFSGLVLTRADTLTVTGTDPTDTAITGSTSFTITPAAVDHLLFLEQPTDTAVGQTISPAVLVAVVDAFGNVETGDNSDTVTLSLGVNPSGGTLSGTLTVTVNGGIATFSDLAIDRAGDGYTLHATVGGSVPDSDSDPFTITL